MYWTRRLGSEAQPKSRVEYGCEHDDSSEEICPEEQPNREADGSVLLALALEMVWKPHDCDDVEDFEEDGEQRCARCQCDERALAVREPP